MSVNIKTDYSATGDGQIASDTCTLAAGTPTTFTTTSNHFNSGDIGKYIGILNPGGASTFLTKIDAVPAANQITLHDSATTFFTSATVSFEWGHDDTQAFKDFEAANVGSTPVTLIIPAGRYCFVAPGQPSHAVGNGIKNLTVIGTGSPTLTDLLGGGSGWALGAGTSDKLVIYNDNQAESFVQTISAGATVLHMVTAADAGKYTANSWAWMFAYDLQGFGFPANPGRSEFVYITAVDAIGGTVTIQDPLRRSYQSNWPQWVLGTAGSGAPNYTGGNSSLGGPAKLMLINNANWDAEQVWDGVNFSSNYSVFNGNIRKLTVKNFSCSTFAPNVSFQREFICQNFSVPNTEWEIDKGTDFVTFDTGTVKRFKGQSMTPLSVTCSNVTMTQGINGISSNWSFDHCDLGDTPTLYPTSYGNGQTLSVTNSHFTGPLIQIVGVQESDFAGSGAWTMNAGGLMSRPIGSGTGEPPQWAVPGEYFVLGSRYKAIYPPWKCIDIYESGGNLYLQTDQITRSSFPLGFNNGVTNLALDAFAALPKINSWFGNTGDEGATGWLGSRLGQHFLKTYSGNIGAASNAHMVQMWGQFVSIKVTITSGYSAGTFALGDSFFFVLSKPGNTETPWAPTFDLTTPGVRTITVGGSNPALGSDANLTIPNSGNIWFVDNQITPFMTGAVGSGTVTLEMVADQGFPLSGVVPLRFRLHA